MGNEEFQLLLDNIRLEIGYQGDVAKVKLEPHEIQELDDIKSGLSIDGRTFSFDPSTARLTIDSTNCPTS